MRNWHLPTIFVALAATAGLHGVVACGGSEDEAKSSSAVQTNFDGTYRPTTSGPIAAISFSHGKDYLLMAKGCNSATCAEIGTYALDTATKTLTLTNAKTKASRNISVEVLSKSRQQPSSGGLVTKDLTEPEEQLTKPGQQLVDAGQSTTGGSSSGSSGGSDKLIDLIGKLLDLVKSAMMDNQKMDKDKDDDDSAKSGSSGTDAGGAQTCTSGLPTATSTAIEIAAYFARCPAGPLTGIFVVDAGAAAAAADE